MMLPAAQSDFRSASSRRPQVLLVEDDARVRRSLQLLLEGEGFCVRAFAGAAALLADESATDAACLVTDYRLGEQDGISLLRAMRRVGWSGPAILMTAFMTSGVAARATREGFAQLFEKPFSPHLLIEALGRILAP